MTRAAHLPDAGDRGTGVFSTAAGFLVFLAFMLFAVQLLTNLYATSVVTSATFDGARLAAESGNDPRDPDTRMRVERHVRGLLGEYGDRLRFDWRGTDPDVVHLRVVATSPSLLLPALGGELPFTTIDRAVSVRVERPR